MQVCCRLPTRVVVVREAIAGVEDPLFPVEAIRGTHGRPAFRLRLPMPRIHIWCGQPIEVRPGIRVHILLMQLTGQFGSSRFSSELR